MDHCVECQVCHQLYDVTTNSQKKNCCQICYTKIYYETKNNNKSRKQRLYENWKRRGVKGNLDQLYDIFINTTHCQLCDVKLTTGRCGGSRKCLDHCHTTGEFRNIICHVCNTTNKSLIHQKYNQPYDRCISMCKRSKTYRYRKEYNKKKMGRFFKTKVDALCFKFIMLLRIRAGHFD